MFIRILRCHLNNLMTSHLTKSVLIHVVAAIIAIRWIIITTSRSDSVRIGSNWYGSTTKLASAASDIFNTTQWTKQRKTVSNYPDFRVFVFDRKAWNLNSDVTKLELVVIPSIQSTRSFRKRFSWTLRKSWYFYVYYSHKGSGSKFFRWVYFIMVCFSV